MKHDTFKTFYDTFLEFRHAVDSKFENYLQENELKTNYETKIKLLENDIRNLRKENHELQNESKSYLKIIETLAEGKHIDAPWKSVSSNRSNSKIVTSSTNDEVLLLSNKFKSLSHQQINEQNEEEYDNTEMNFVKSNQKENQVKCKNKRPSHCITEKYIRNQKDVRRRTRVVPGQRTYGEATSYGKKVLFVGDSHLRRINRIRLNKSFKNAKAVIKSFSGAKVQDLQHYVIPPLEEEKPDVAVIHIGSNNASYNRLDVDPAVIAGNIIEVGKKCIEYGVQDVVVSSVFVKNSIKLSAFIRKVNDELRTLCSSQNFHFVSNDNIIRKYLCSDGVHLSDSGTELLAGNIVKFLNEVVLNVNINEVD